MIHIYNSTFLVPAEGYSTTDYGVIYEGKYRVRYFDIDGNIIKIEYVEPNQPIDPPVANYDPARLYVEGWTISEAQAAALTCPIDVAPVYDTLSGGSWFDVEVGPGQTLTFNSFTVASACIDWGDGTVMTSNTTHTYESAGRYQIHVTDTMTPVTDSSIKSGTLSGPFGSSYNNTVLKRVYLGHNLGGTAANNWLYSVSQCNLEALVLYKGIPFWNNLNAFNSTFWPVLAISPEVTSVESGTDLRAQRTCWDTSVTRIGSSTVTYQWNDFQAMNQNRDPYTGIQRQIFINGGSRTTYAYKNAGYSNIIIVLAPTVVSGEKFTTWYQDDRLIVPDNLVDAYFSSDSWPFKGNDARRNCIIPLSKAHTILPK